MFTFFRYSAPCLSCLFGLQHNSLRRLKLQTKRVMRNVIPFGPRRPERAEMYLGEERRSLFSPRNKGNIGKICADSAEMLLKIVQKIRDHNMEDGSQPKDNQ